MGRFLLCFSALTAVSVAFIILAKSIRRELSPELSNIGDKGLEVLELFAVLLVLVLFGEKGVRVGDGDLALFLELSYVLAVGEGGEGVLVLFLGRVGVGAGVEVSITSLSWAESRYSLFGQSDPFFVNILGVELFCFSFGLNLSLASLIMRPARWGGAWVWLGDWVNDWFGVGRGVVVGERLGSG